MQRVGAPLDALWPSFARRHRRRTRSARVRRTVRFDGKAPPDGGFGLSRLTVLAESLCGAAGSPGRPLWRGRLGRACPICPRRDPARRRRLQPWKMSTGAVACVSNHDMIPSEEVAASAVGDSSTLKSVAGWGACLIRCAVPPLTDVRPKMGSTASPAAFR